MNRRSILGDLAREGRPGHRHSAETRRKRSQPCPHLQKGLSFFLCTKVLSASHSVAEFLLIVSDSSAPWTVACQTPLSVEFSRQEYWSGLPFSYPGDLPNSRTEPRSLALQEDPDSKESTCNAGDPGSIPGSGRSPREENGNPCPIFLPGKFHGQRRDLQFMGSQTVGQD